MRKLLLFFTILCPFLLSSCGSDEVNNPHPKGYFRIDLPEKKYSLYSADCPFRFEIPGYSHIEPDTNQFAEPCWINVDYTRFKAKLHLSYKPVHNNLRDYLEQSRMLAVQHEVKANAMKESPVVNDSAHVYGLIYEFGGNTASSFQFYLTDTTHHFLRGALYFFARPNSDSTAPVYEFLRKDIYHMIETFRWKNDVVIPEKKKEEAEKPKEKKENQYPQNKTNNAAIKPEK